MMHAQALVLASCVVKGHILCQSRDSLVAQPMTCSSRPPPLQDGINVRSCFRVTYVGCDTTRKCCRGMLAAVDKLAVRAAGSCSLLGCAWACL